MLETVVAHELVLGVRRLPARGWRHKRQYELGFRDGGAASCSLARLDNLVDGGRVPADFWAVVGAADEAFAAGRADLIDWPSGVAVPGTSTSGSQGAKEVLRRTGPWIESSLGYRVRSTGRAGFEYVDFENALLKIDSEWMVAPRAVIFTSSLPDDRPEVLEHVMRAWLWAGFDIDLDPPIAWR